MIGVHKSLGCGMRDNGGSLCIPVSSRGRLRSRLLAIVIKCDLLAKDRLRAGEATIQVGSGSKMAVGDLGSKNSLVPFIGTLQPLPLPCLSHLWSEATFLTHLLVTADPIHKGRSIRRPTPRQAQAAYQSTDQNLTAAQITIRDRSA
jgi:hypothetical protein